MTVESFNMKPFHNFICFSFYRYAVIAITALLLGITIAVFMCRSSSQGKFIALFIFGLLMWIFSQAFIRNRIFVGQGTISFVLFYFGSMFAVLWLTVLSFDIWLTSRWDERRFYKKLLSYRMNRILDLLSRQDAELEAAIAADRRFKYYKIFAAAFSVYFVLMILLYLGLKGWNSSITIAFSQWSGCFC